MSPYPPLDLATEVIPNFPGLTPGDGKPFIFADNAGGSQILQQSVDAITSYLVHSNVQMGGGYKLSMEAGKLMCEAKKATATLVNCPAGNRQAEDGVVFASSTTQAATNLAYACELAGAEGILFQPGDEIILTTADHEGEYRRC
jgi:selenocysteine lyase/cysteine desulfurase